MLMDFQLFWLMNSKLHIKIESDQEELFHNTFDAFQVQNLCNKTSFPLKIAVILIYFLHIEFLNHSFSIIILTYFNLLNVLYELIEFVAHLSFMSSHFEHSDFISLKVITEEIHIQHSTVCHMKSCNVPK